MLYSFLCKKCVECFVATDNIVYGIVKLGFGAILRQNFSQSSLTSVSLFGQSSQDAKVIQEADFFVNDHWCGFGFGTDKVVALITTHYFSPSFISNSARSISRSSMHCNATDLEKQAGLVISSLRASA